jgi:hypothetical protein
MKNEQTEDAVDELQTVQFWTDRATADAEVRKYVRINDAGVSGYLFALGADTAFFFRKVNRFAARTREEWKTEILRQ